MIGLFVFMSTLGQVDTLEGGPKTVLKIATPERDIRDGTRDIPPREMPYIRYLSLYRLSYHDKAGMEKAVSFTLNSLSTQRRITVPKRVGDVIIVDLRDYGIKKRIWDALAAKHPYGGPKHLIRADWFIYNVSKAPVYYDFLRVKTEKEFKELMGSRDEFRQAAIDGQKFVSRWPTLFGGYVWSSSRPDATDRPIRQLLENKEMQYIGSLPNGLMAYFIADSMGKAQDYDDPKVAFNPKSADGLVRAGLRCVVCHADGVNKVNNNAKDVLKKEFFDKESLKQLLETYGGELPFDRDREAYQKAVLSVTKMKSEELTNTFIKILNYYDGDVIKKMALYEADITEERLKQFDDVCIMMLRMDRSIRRDDFERIFMKLKK